MVDTSDQSNSPLSSIKGREFSDSLSEDCAPWSKLVLVLQMTITEFTSKGLFRMVLLFQLMYLIYSYEKNFWRSKLCKFIIKVIRIPETSDETYEKITAWGKALGKTTITCKDTPGFVVNRLLVPLLAEAVRMLERGKLFGAT